MIIVGIAKNTDRDLLLDKVAKEYFNINNLAYERLALSKLSNGKPYLVNSNLHVSISHSGEYLAIALSPTPVGVDIQKKEEVDYQKIGERYGFKAKDINEFYQKFTLAEGEAKREGNGLAYALKKVDLIDGKTIELDDYVLSVVPNEEIFFLKS